MYQTDEHGEYRMTERFVSAHAGGGPYVANWTVCEVREYADGKMRVHREPIRYGSDEPALAATLEIYMITARELGL